MTATYDVVIIGAGPAGSAAALRLARGGLRVALLERSAFDRPRIGESFAPAIKPLLSELGLWENFQALEPLPSYGTKCIWGSFEPAIHSHLFTPYGLGWHVDRVAFDRMVACAAASAGAELQLQARVTQCTRNARGWTIQAATNTAGNQKIHAAVILDGTGRMATFARQERSRRIVFDRLVGIAARFSRPQASSACYTLVEATAHGWWYSAPIAGNGYVAVFMTDGDLVKPNGFATPSGWMRAFWSTTATAERLRVCASDCDRSTSLLRLFSAASHRMLREETTSPYLAVGDAALSVDPISGSGVIRALRTAQASAVAVAQILSGSPHAIAEYEDDRNSECTQYLAERAFYYSMEDRWPDAPFWQRRHLGRAGSPTTILR